MSCSPGEKAYTFAQSAPVVAAEVPDCNESYQATRINDVDDRIG